MIIKVINYSEYVKKIYSEFIFECSIRYSNTFFSPANINFQFSNGWKLTWVNDISFKGKTLFVITHNVPDFE